MGESCQSRHCLGLDRLAIIPFCSVRNLVFWMCVVRFGIRADNRRFYNYISSPKTSFASRARNHKVGQFFPEPFPVRTRFAFVSLKLAYYRLMSSFSTPACSASASRCKSRPSKHKLRIQVWAGKGLLWLSVTARLLSPSGDPPL